MKFGDKLCQLRKQMGLSQEEFGELLNVTRQTVSKWELGQSKPDTDKLMEISKVLNVDFNKLIDDEVVIERNDEHFNTDELKPRKWLLVLLIIVAIIIVIVIANKIVMDYKNKEDSSSSGIFDIFDSKMFDSFSNSLFEQYTGTEYGSQVESLLDKIITNNKTNSNHIITVVYVDTNTSDTTKIKDLKLTLDSWSKYEVSADYDKNGYINKITIESIKEEEKDISTSQFNHTFEWRVGTNYGSVVGYLLDDVITNNKTNSKHIVRVVYNTVDTIDPTEIKNLKKSFDSWTKYEVSADYDEAGYINLITIENY